VSFVSLIAAFAIGSTQHLKTSIYVFVVAAVAVFLCLPLVLTRVYYYLPMEDDGVQLRMREKAPRDHRSRNKIYLMTLGILMGSVTYQAGLDPPGGSWQSGSAAGHPVMHDKRRNRYLAFLLGNSTSFAASMYLIEILLFPSSPTAARGWKWQSNPWWWRSMLDSYWPTQPVPTGSTWKTRSWHAIVMACLALVKLTDPENIPEDNGKVKLRYWYFLPKLASQRN
jgi:hypothetical protein